MSLAITDDATLAVRAGVPLEVVELVRSCEVIDLHLETFIPPRLWGYDLHARHDDHWLGGHFFGHLDFPRALDGGLTGAMWSIATNVLRGRSGKLRAIRENVARLRAEIEKEPALAVVRDHAELVRARAEGKHAAMICVQGGNAYEAQDDPDFGDVVRVTVLHLTTSGFGRTSSPLGRGERGLTGAGKRFVERLDAARVFVDLAHIDREGFWHAVDVHDRNLPFLVTHTGVCGVREHWRNVDDDQIRAVARSGGVVGVIFEPSFLRRRGGPRDAAMVVEHLAHLIAAGGEDVAAIGSDYDGLITPPPDLRDGGLAYYRLVHAMLEAGFGEDRIRKILGLNFLRALHALRPGREPAAG
ncbi:MAG: dipeptidase [Sandaracinaceae bacterium]|nr:dipeptidase [Sandaracinaceae bacterium]